MGKLKTALAYYIDALEAEAEAQKNYAYANATLDTAASQVHRDRCDMRRGVLRDCAEDLAELLEIAEEEA